MWFIFPRVAGLGHSTMAERYAIRDLDQAKRYLDDPTLGERLRHDVHLMLRHAGKSALQILGAPDDLKFRSCLTLFARAASNDDDRCLFKQALDQFYEGGPDPLTENRQGGDFLPLATGGPSAASRYSSCAGRSLRARRSSVS